MNNHSQQTADGLQGKELLQDRASVQRLLGTAEAKTVFQALKGKDAAHLQAAAQAALNGSAAQLNVLMSELARDPKAAQAMEKLNQTLSNRH